MSDNALDTTQIVSTLKEELKTWEKAFARANDGRKPSREDIKADPTIAAKYKQYDRARRPAKTREETKNQFGTPRRKRQTTHVHATPSKGTPTHARTQSGPDNLANQENDSPSKVPTCSVIGPTPQKDGRVLGLFDYLPSSTPRRVKQTALSEITVNCIQTPSKTTERSTIPQSASPQKFSRTPQSTGKRFLLDTFMTPSKRQRTSEEGTPAAAKHTQTPMFLRRCSQPERTLEGEDVQAVQPFRRKSFGRSLSSMIQNMRREQEARLDEEWEVLREIEDGGPPKPVAKSDEKVEETQFYEDEDAMAALAELESQEQGVEAVPQKRQWKKKGQKRQTRRVIMRPVRTKPQARTTAEAESGGDGSSDDSSTDEVANDDWSSADEDADLDFEEGKAKLPSKAKRKEKTAATKAAPKKPDGKRKMNPNAASHANFRSLKIKNKNSKANGRRGFGRGR